MATVLVCYYSKGGNTRKMAEALEKGLIEAGCRVNLKKVDQVQLEDLKNADGVMVGSPCYFGSVAAEVKSFLDKAVQLFGTGDLEGKPGSAFVSGGSIGGGGDLAMMTIVTGLLVYGMVVQGYRKTGHLGTLSIGAPDDRVLQECHDQATKFAALVKKLAER
ncbi:flavodoxin family protein [Dethiosulfatarculus sandiegensis]|uniref:Flavodoxin n=1 Tax=Dethiosulfatarculus sandiegensis TaxID=1429043 RepID=A0A0D2JWY9_9BACT|nr:NAD(P)H-dependent oxidoreductase [Dethiosulfatarculus sandiegensis]KIX14080.1 flavodoxin [Dethiosulfatarculus sandiegensis]